MSGDHEFFIGRNDPHGNPAGWSGDPRGLLCVQVTIQLDAEPGGRITNPLAYFGRVLADSSRKHQTVDAAQGRRERSDLLRRPIDEVLHSKLRGGLAASQELTHVGTDS